MSAATFELKVVCAVALVGAVAYTVYKGAGAAKKAAEAINPFNNDNIINQAATSVYQSVTGSKGSIGTDIYDLTHPDMTETNNAMRKEIEESGYPWQL